MLEGPTRVTLAALNDGAAEQLFAREFERTLENIADPNTDPEAKRTITLKIEITADPERRNAEIIISANSKLAAMRPVAHSAALGTIEGERAAVQSTARQLEMFDESQPETPGLRAVPFVPPENGGLRE